jgi:LysM repeat protein
MREVISKNTALPILLRSIALVVIAACVVVAPQANTVVQGQENILKNPGFEGGWYDLSGTQQVGNNWRMDWMEGETPPEAQMAAAKPESRILPKNQIPTKERDIFLRDGSYCMKIFWSNTPIYVALSQDVSGLEVGRKYQFVAPVYVDVFDWDGGKQAPTDADAARVRLGAGPKGVNWRDRNAIQYSGWWNGSNTSNFFLNYNTYVYEFVATAPEMRVFVEMWTKWGLDNNGFFLDGLGLYPQEMEQTPTPTPPPPPPTATPGPSPTPPATSTPRPDGATVHIVEEGDTLFGIALQYDVSPDQLRELNAGSLGPNDMLQIGQEIVVSLPDEEATPTELPSPTPTLESDEEATPEGEGEGGENGGEETEGEGGQENTEEGSSVCVLAYHDRNSDTFRDPNGEELLPNAEFTIANASGVIDNYTSDGVSEPYCFTGLAPGAYRVIQTAPPGYEPSGSTERDVALSENTSLELQFGNARSEETESGEAGESTESAEATEGSSNENTNSDGGSSFSNILSIVARVAGVMVLILAAAIAVLFVLTQRRRLG